MPPKQVAHEVVSAKHPRRRVELQTHPNLTSFGLIDAKAGEEKVTRVEISCLNVQDQQAGSRLASKTSLLVPALLHPVMPRMVAPFGNAYPSDQLEQNPTARTSHVPAN